ncbi:hypothetical protein QC761_0036290 [Podospora bellae-mahoneyi]|uniref:FAD linked oxidase N-terminal domain-containing protein n=1 Tax=Podospora bellae-mahoneyi TaxID=2093777 RepID=A0ABR0FP96_9PEZI|nr:hypothetical protein QC761_0036290 [Podospora bellae-mahoneyi]
MDAGCLWGMVYETLVIGKHDGFIINGGRYPTVGVSGFILGGGLGPFTRSFGMGCDTLVEAKVVTADGRLITVRETSKKGSPEERLFWALQGAGAASFGAVVRMKLRVRKLSSLNGFVGGITDDVVKVMNAFYLTNWPDKMTIDSTWICDLRQSNNGGVRFNISFNGRKSEYDRTIEKLLQVRPTENDTVEEEVKSLKEQLKRRALA